MDINSHLSKHFYIITIIGKNQGDSGSQIKTSLKNEEWINENKQKLQNNFYDTILVSEMRVEYVM